MIVERMEDHLDISHLITRDSNIIDVKVEKTL